MIDNIDEPIDDNLDSAATGNNSEDARWAKINEQLARAKLHSSATKDIAPEQAGSAMRIGKQLNIPPMLALENQSLLNKGVLDVAIDRLPADYPAVLDYVSRDPMLFANSKDELDGLKAIEDSLRQQRRDAVVGTSARGTFERVASGLAVGLRSAQLEMADTAEERKARTAQLAAVIAENERLAKDPRLNQMMAESQREFDRGNSLGGWARTLAFIPELNGDEALGVGTMLLESVITGIGGFAIDAVLSAGAVAAGEPKAVMTAATGGTAVRNVARVYKTLSDQARRKAAGAASVSASAGVITYEGAYPSYLVEGWNKEENATLPVMERAAAAKKYATQKAAAEGLVNAAISPTGLLVPGGLVGKSVGLTLTSAAGGGAGAAAASAAVGEPISMSDVAAETVFELFGGVVDVGAATWGERKAQAYNDRLKATIERAGQMEKTLRALSSSASNLASRERSPGTLAQFVDMAIEQHGTVPSELGIGARHLLEAVGEEGIAQLRSKSERFDQQVDEAMQTDGEIVLDTAELVEWSAGLTPEQQKIIAENVREHDGALTVAEAEEAKAELGRFNQEAAADVADEDAADGDYIFEKFHADLVAADQERAATPGAARIDPQSNARYAELMKHAMVTIAKRAGMKPRVLFDRFYGGVSATEGGKATEVVDAEARQPADILRDIAAASGNEAWIAAVQDGTFVGLDTLNVDSSGNVVVTRQADSELGLLKSNQTMTREELKSVAEGGGSFGHAGVNTSAMSQWGKRDWAAAGEGATVGEFSIPPADLLNLIRSGDAAVANVSLGEIVFRPGVLDKYLTRLNGKPVGPAQEKYTTNEGRRFRDFFKSITEGTAGSPKTSAASVKVLNRERNNEVVDEFMKHSGNFDRHIEASIPGFRDIQFVIADAIVSTFENADMLDIGASEGALVKTIAARGNNIRTVALDPNPGMADTFANKSTVPGAEYSMTALGTAEQEGQLAWEEEGGVAINYFKPDRKFDIVHEAMVFQFISNDRESQIARVVELLKDDGVAIFEQKFIAGEGLSQEEWKANEVMKDAFKEQFFNKEEMKTKAETVLVGMNQNMVSPGEFERVLRGKFQYVARFWKSGNFAGYIATNDPKRFEDMLGNIGDTSSPFSQPTVEQEMTFDQRVSTRLPTAVKAKENPIEDNLVIGLEAAKADSKTFAKNIEVIRGYLNFRDNPSANTPDKAAEQFIKHVVDNLLWLHDTVPPGARARAKRWYDGANAIASRWAAKYNLSEAQVAGVMAVLSPQKDWFQNVSLAERVLDILTAQGDTVWDEKMSATAEGIAVLKSEDYAPIIGKKLSELSSDYERAVFIRVYDETFNTRAYRIVTPEGEFADYATNADGVTRSKPSWGSFSEIGKAVSIVSDGSIENISARLGKQHKVRNFYNNIFNPNSEHGDVTMDTHAIAAALLRPLSGGSDEVLHNFGSNGASSSAVFGANGTYGIFAEAYRRAAKTRGILPREMQSITWEAVRSLFTDSFKRNEKNVAAVDAVWAKYKSKRISLDEARKQAYEIAGGISTFEWDRPGDGTSSQPWASSYSDELDTSGRLVGAAGAGGRGAPSGDSETTVNQEEPAIAPLPGAPQVAGAMGPDPSLVAVAQKYAADNGIPFSRQSEYVEVDEAFAKRLADAYEQMQHDPKNPRVQEAYENLIRQTRAQYDALIAAGYSFTFFDSASDPYAGNPWGAMRDLRANKRMAVYGTYDGYGTGSMINIGLAKPGSAELLTKDEIVAAVEAAGGEIVQTAGHVSDSEPTLVIKLKTKMSDADLYALAQALGQEAIAQRFDDETGTLQGPNAEAWGGKYNPDLFLVMDGRRATQVASPMLTDTGLRWPDQAGVMRVVTPNDLFRAVHDAFGHGLESAGFRARGEENAWQAHRALFTGSAIAALTSETRGQNSWLNYGPYGEKNRVAGLHDTIFAEQKIGLMPEWAWTEKVVGHSYENPTIVVDGVERPTTNSLGQPIARTKDGLENFWRWFGDSKVVDADGKPLVVYHGGHMDPEEFSAFDPELTDPGNDMGAGFYFTSSRSDAEGYDYNREYGEPTVIPVYLSFQNPFVIGESVLPGWNSEQRGEDFRAAVEDAGYDGIIDPTVKEKFKREEGYAPDAVHYIAFRPEQIKSVNNRSTFSPTDPNILNQLDMFADEFVDKSATTSVERVVSSARGAEAVSVGNVDSSGNQIAYSRGGLENFWREFSDSQAVDEAGRPLRMYHATQSDFGAFEIGRPTQNNYGILGNVETRRYTISLTADADATTPYADKDGKGGGQVMPVYLIANNPADFRNGVTQEIEDAARSQGVSIPWLINMRNTWELFDGEDGRLFVEALKRAGYDSAVIVEDKHDGEGDHETWMAFEPEQIKSVFNRGTFDPNNPDVLAQQPKRKRGSFDVRSFNIALMDPNKTTTLHELGHMFFEMMVHLAAEEGAPKQIVDDVNAMLKFLEFPGTAEDYLKVPVSRRRKSHETMAEHFEAYLRSGKAPTVELQGLFRTFAKWLIEAYGALTRMIGVGKLGNVDMDPELRAIFDRMLATDEAIEQSAKVRALMPQFETAEQAGMTEEEFAEYQSRNSDVLDGAAEDLRAKLIRDMRWLNRLRDKTLRELTADAKAKRKAIRDEVTAEADRMRVYRVMHFLKRGVMLDENGAEVQAPWLIESSKLNKAAVEALFPNGEVDVAKLGFGKYGMVSANGVDPGVIAGLFGYQSADEMVRDIVGAEPRGQLIDGMTEQRMLERYAEIATPEDLQKAADEAIASEAHTRMVATELAALDARRGKVSVLRKAAKYAAMGILGRRTVRNLRPDLSASAATRSRKDSAKALAAGKRDEAAAAKRNELLHVELERQGREAKREIEAFLRATKKVWKGGADKVAKSRDVDLVMAARMVLGRYGIGSPASMAAAANYVAMLAKYDGPHRQQVLDMTAGLPAPKEYKGLTLDEIRHVADIALGLYQMALDEKTMTIDGQKVAIDAVADRIVEGVKAKHGGQMPSDRATKRTPTPWDEKVDALRSLKANLSRVEFWAGNMGAVFKEAILQPVGESISKYRTRRSRMIKAYKGLLDEIAPTLTFKPITCKPGELTGEDGKPFTFSGGLSEIIHAILHTGNESNKRKLMLGRGWATENADGTLSHPGWDTFIARLAAEGTLTKEHFDFCQKVWDLLDSMKQDAQAAHKAVYGFYFHEITANELQTPFGTYRGGYVPAITDPRDVSESESKKDAEELLQSGNSFAFPTAPTGFTKQRVEYNRALHLDLRVLASHIDKVCRFTDVQPAVRDVAKLLMNKRVANALNRHDKKVINNMLIPWLQVSANQVTTRPGKDRTFDKFISTIDSRTGMAIMFASVINTLQQSTGFSAALVRTDENGNYLATSPEMLRQIAAYMAGPKDYVALAVSRSAWLDDRMHNHTMEMRGAIDDILVNASVIQKAESFFARNAYFLQVAFQNTIDPIVFNAAYETAIARGATEKQARRAGEELIRTTLGTFAPEDVSAVEINTPIVRSMLKFYGFFNMWGNLLGSEASKALRQAGYMEPSKRLAFLWFAGLAMPAYVASLMAGNLPDDEDDEDGDGMLDEYLADFFGVQGRSLAAMVPGVGPITNFVVNLHNDKPYDDRLNVSPLMSTVESAVKSSDNLLRGEYFDEEVTKREVRDMSTLIAIATGIPTGPLAKMYGYEKDLESGRIEERGALGDVWGYATGK